MQVAEAAAAGEADLEARFPGTAAAAARWTDLHRQAAAAGGYLGSTWGDDRFVREYCDRFLLGFVGPQSRVLELGPGGGRYTERLLAEVARVDVVDVSAEILAALAQRLGRPANLHAHRGSGRTLRGLGLGTYDLVFAVNLFQFLDLENVHAYLVEAVELLAPDGVGVIQYADLTNPAGRTYFKANVGAWNQHQPPHLKFHFLAKDLVAAVLADAGAVVLRHEQHHRDTVVTFARAAAAGRRPRYRPLPAELAGSARHLVLGRGLDAAEREWWAQQNELDEVVAAAARTPTEWIADQRHLDPILGALRPGATVVDYGCGHGWLAQRLARAGAGRVVGVDFSPAQLAAARRLLPPDLAGRVELVQGSDLPAGLAADVVVCHAILHHLTWQEIEATAAAIHRILAEGGTLWLVEPVAGGGRRPPWRRLVSALALPFSPWRGWRPMRAAERRLRERLDAHLYGPRLPAHGPSPKELPFAPGELEGFLADRFVVRGARPVFVDAHLVDHELRLFGASFPRLARLLRPVVVRLAASVERRALRRAAGPLGEGWVFTLFELAKRG